MKAPAFKYARPDTLDGALTLLDRYVDRAKLLAGGQSLMPALNMRLSSPEILIDINRISDISGIELVGNYLRIGALTRHVELERDPLIEQYAPMLAKAMPHVAHAAIRNRGTIGGSLAFADPAAELPACAVALEARLVADGPQGRRVLKAEEFFRDLFQTALRADEMLVAIEIPVARPQIRHEFSELARRQGDYAIVGVAMSCAFSNGLFESGRMAYFGMGNTPILAHRAMTELNGHPNSAETRNRILNALEDEFEPPDDLNASPQMRVHLAKILTRRVLERFDR